MISWKMKGFVLMQQSWHKHTVLKGGDWGRVIEKWDFVIVSNSWGSHWSECSIVRFAYCSWFTLFWKHLLHVWVQYKYTTSLQSLFLNVDQFIDSSVHITSPAPPYYIVRPLNLFNWISITLNLLPESYRHRNIGKIPNFQTCSETCHAMILPNAHS